VKNYASIVSSIKTTPVDIGGRLLTYPVLISALLGDLYSPDAGTFADSDLSAVWDLLHGASPAVSAAKKTLVTRLSATSMAQDRAAAFRDKAKSLSPASRFAVQWPYNNSPEAFQSVLCTDGLNPANAATWTGHAAAADRAAPGFGPLWTWASAPCASNTWTVRDPGAYRGPFTKRTSNPVLIVGSYWDPATNYAGAVTVSRLLPNSRLLSNDNWGHTAWGTSSCDTAATANYLLAVTVPAPGAVCHSDVQPYTQPLPSTGIAKAPSQPAPADGQRAPIVPLVPAGVAPMA
jgi:hypothetical protein